MNENSQYLQLFFDESAEYIQVLNEKVLELEGNPDELKEIIDSMFRAAHSLKGMAATMGFEKLTNLSHRIENLMDEIRNGKINVNTKLIDLLFTGIDYISEIVEEIKNYGSEDIDISEYLKNISDYLNGDYEIEDDKKLIEKERETNNNTDNEEQQFELKLDKEEIARIENGISHIDNVYNLTVILDQNSLYKDVRGYMVLKKAEELGTLVKVKPSKEELEKEDLDFNNVYLIVVSNLSTEEIEKELVEITDVIEVKIEEIEIEYQNSRRQATASKKAKNQGKKTPFQSTTTVRVDVSRLDELMNMVGELLINKTRLESLNINNEIYSDIIPQLDRVTMDLHHIVMQIRMVPIGIMFNRFPRMVRDLSKQMGKEINLLIEGETTELDRSIIDELSDPMIHLLRNAIDHGIEEPGLRKSTGKSNAGTIILKAYQKGSEILIEVEDDGQGISADEIVEIAIKKGIISTKDVEKMDLNEKLNLIFAPGFSTSSKVSDISGRGVGMDVVKRAVEKLDGKIFIESEKGTGTRFTIALPLTLAITEALMVKIDGEIFAIPLNAIEETLTISGNEIKQINKQNVILLRDKTVPLIDSKKSLNLVTEDIFYKNKEDIPVVIINSVGKQIGLIVDELLNQQEIVVKSLGEYIGEVKNISGATIIGDGEVALILDVRNIA